MIRWLSPKGRIGRRTFWWAYLIPVGFTQVVLWMWSTIYALVQLASQADIVPELLNNIQSRVVGTPEYEAAMRAMRDEVMRFDSGSILWANLAIMLLCIPMLAGGAKRWRDIGQSGWWSLLLLIPALGYIIFFLLGCLRGRPQPALAA